MYWLLNYVPVFLQIVPFGIALNARISYNIPSFVYCMLNLFVLPLYLLVINAIGISEGRSSFAKSIGCMLSAIIWNLVVILATRKIQTEYFIADVPEELYYFLIGIPSVIVLIGMGIMYFLKRIRGNRQSACLPEKGNRYVKKTCIALGVFVFVALTACMYMYHKTCYLNLKFSTCISGEWVATEASWIETTPGITLKGYPEAEEFTTATITDRQAINKVVDYLNSILLTYVREGENFDEQDGGTIHFFDEHGHSLGSVSISHDNYIHDSRNVTTYKARDKDTSIISCLENLDLKK